MNILSRIAGSNPLDHIVQHPLVTREVDLGFFNFLVPEGVVTLFSDHISMIFLAGLLLMTFIPLALRGRKDDDAIGRLVPNGFGNFIEAICAYLRDTVAQPLLGEHTDRFIKYIWSLFFFVLTLNLLGMLPIAAIAPTFGIHLGGTATANVWVVGALSVLTLIMMVVNGIRFGGADYVKHLFTGGAPAYMIPIMLPVEIIGLIARIVALTMRLFANMIAGHLLLAVLLSFILTAGAASWIAGSLVALPVVFGSVAITMLELFVAFVQAFIFSFLTTLFIALSVNVHHDEAEAH